MSKADKMFKELGYVTPKKDCINSIIYKYRMDGHEIVFDKLNKEYHAQYHNIVVTITAEEHLAIHEKLKELGWIE